MFAPKIIHTGITHNYLTLWPTLGPFRYPQRLKKALLGALEVLGRPQRSSEGPKGPDLVPTATGPWYNELLEQRLIFATQDFEINGNVIFG